MIAPLYESEPLSARIYAAKLDEDYDLTNEWIMVVRPHYKYATFYSVQAYDLPSKGRMFPEGNPFTTTRFIVQFTDLIDDPEGEIQGPCIIFPTFKEDIASRWHKMGEIMVEREQLINLIRTVGVFSPQEDDDWTERVVLSNPEIEEQDITEAKAERLMNMRHKSTGPGMLDETTTMQLGRMDIRAF